MAKEMKASARVSFYLGNDAGNVNWEIDGTPWEVREWLRQIAATLDDYAPDEPSPTRAAGLCTESGLMRGLSVQP